MASSLIFPAVALFFGIVFFAFAARYYLFTATVFILQFISSLQNGNGKPNGHNGASNKSRPPTGSLNGFSLDLSKDKNGSNGNGNGNHAWQSEPFFSIHIATYNERNVIDRLISSCVSLDYSNYEVIIVDDSTDETVDALERWKQSQAEVSHTASGGQMQQTLLAMIPRVLRPALKIIHREKRTGFKGAALNEALRHMDPKAEYVVVLDADFVPAPDFIKQFLTYIRVADVSSIFSEIVRLDDAFSKGEVGLEDFLKKRESLVAKVAGRGIGSVAKGGRKAILELDRLYAENLIKLETYLRRRQFILDMLKTLGLDLLTYEPLGDRSSLINAHELDELLAHDRIDLAEYISRRKVLIPREQKETTPGSSKITFGDIIKLDRLYAAGRVRDEAWYRRERAWLAKSLLADNEREKLPQLFEIGQFFAKGEIDADRFAKTYLKLRGDAKSNGNGLRNGRNGRQILWRGRKNGYGKGEATIWPYERGGNDGDSKPRVNGHDHANGDNGVNDEKVVVVQGYQWHYLNKSESWLTVGIRTEYSGNYVIERTCQEIYGGMKMISGSVYAIRADVLRRYGWSTSITEDWELTCRLYKDGYKVKFTPTIQVPAEAPSTIRRLIRQRQRWAEGHTYNAKKYFFQILNSPHVTLREKIEFLYFAPYYLQSLFMIIGTVCWIVSEQTHQYLPFWTAVFGWCLLLSNLIALPLMNLGGLFAEGTLKRDFTGVLSTIIISYILAPFQAYSALKGLFEKEEGPWIRTFKTGRITEPIIHGKVGKTRRRLRSKSVSEGNARSSGGTGTIENVRRMIWQRK